MQELYETYEKSRKLVGKRDGTGTVLLPIAHSTQNAQIEVAINLQGEFQCAKTVEKADAVTIIPVTEDSGARSNGITPHPLHDKLCYVAGDYAAHCKKKKAGEYYEAYIRQFDHWHRAGCHPMVEAVYQYVKKGSLIQDLVNAKVLMLDGEGNLDDKVKINGIAVSEAFVRFFILDMRVPGSGKIWEDQEVYDDYIRHQLTQMEKLDLDYITGERQPCSDKQPSKIRNSGDKTKLISANDERGFTYRGRFSTKQEAISIGYVPSQEAHNALRWLIQRQGYRKHDMCVVAWNPGNKEVPQFMEPRDSLWDDEEEEVIPTADVAEHYAKKVKRAIEGNYADIADPKEEVVVMELDAATPGRLSVAYFRQMRGSEFLDRLVQWNLTCTWHLSYLKKGKPVWAAPSPEDIVLAAFGVERSNFLDVDDKFMKATLRRLMPCIVDGKKIPKDIVRAAVENASRPLAFSNYNHKKIREIACALIYKEYCDERKEDEITMYLERENANRDYLYGRLLALAHKVEYDTFGEDEKGKRETNAKRLTNVVSRDPGRFMPVLKGKLEPYWKKLPSSSKTFYEKEEQEIYSMFSSKNFGGNAKLGPLYLLGYEHELAYLWDHSKVNEGGNEDE